MPEQKRLEKNKQEIRERLEGRIIAHKAYLEALQYRRGDEHGNSITFHKEFGAKRADEEKIGSPATSVERYLQESGKNYKHCTYYDWFFSDFFNDRLVKLESLDPSFRDGHVEERLEVLKVLFGKLQHSSDEEFERAFKEKQETLLGASFGSTVQCGKVVCWTAFSLASLSGGGVFLALSLMLFSSGLGLQGAGGMMLFAAALFFAAGLSLLLDAGREYVLFKQGQAVCAEFVTDIEKALTGTPSEEVASPEAASLGDISAQGLFAASSLKKDERPVEEERLEEQQDAGNGKSASPSCPGR
eukprot:TRINITY_DN5641_c1_g1_i3.p2 TRINITY_DN5641_c1_g1~~TRINITY_DN5641_c1_g1_i3.p2  ORF type:complete len:301 (+),score=-29.83 TRINITY_DN5641_c1_g1_i3:440-1342(+)